MGIVRNTYFWKEVKNTLFVAEVDGQNLTAHLLPYEKKFHKKYNCVRYYARNKTPTSARKRLLMRLQEHFFHFSHQVVW